MYASDLQGQLDGITGVPDNVRAALTDNVGAALDISHRLTANGAEIGTAARNAFVTSMSSSLWVGVGLAALAALIAFVHLPKHTPTSDRHAVATGTATGVRP